MATLLEELDGLISALNENRIEYAVCGGLALVDQLRELCLSLMKAKKVSDEKAGKNKPAAKKIDVKN